MASVTIVKLPVRSAAGSDDTEAFGWEQRVRGEHALRRANILQDTTRIVGQQLVDHFGDRFGAHWRVGETHLSVLGDHVRLVADVKDERFTVHEDDRLQEGGDQSHFAQEVPAASPAREGSRRFSAETGRAISANSL